MPPPTGPSLAADLAMELDCSACGHRNLASAKFCSSCGVQQVPDSVTTETPAVSVEVRGIDLIDRSAFSPHEGLFVVVQGSKTGARYALDADLVTLGRHPKSDIFLNDVTVSRRHAEVRRSGARYIVADVASLNGTYINGDRTEGQELLDGDEVQVGKFKFVFVYGTGDA